MPAAQLTVAEAADWLSPRLTARELGALIRIAGIERAGVRRTPGQSGKPASVYDMAELIALHAALTPWLRKRKVTRG